MFRSTPRFASAVIFAFLACGNSEIAHTRTQTDTGVIVTARKPLEPIAEARQLVAEMERKGVDPSGSSSIRFTTVKLYDSSSGSRSGTGIQTVSTDAAYSEANSGDALVLRTEKSLEAIVLAGNLRAGVYTMWWVVFNNADRCTDSRADVETKCVGDDGSDLRLDGASIYWATGAVVGSDGIGVFHATTMVGDDLGRPGEQHIRGEGLVNPLNAEVHLVIKYGGHAQEDVDELSHQLTSMPEECVNESGAADLGAFATHCNEARVAIIDR